MFERTMNDEVTARVHLAKFVARLTPVDLLVLEYSGFNDQCGHLVFIGHLHAFVRHQLL